MMDLQQDFAQLKLLYREVPRFIEAEDELHPLTNLVRTFNAVRKVLVPTKPNPTYPKEDYETFVCRMIESKKARIRNELGI